ncbi:hypothetical protein Acr_16g0009600 [Actinidia rufa]|uniref:Uncharacterized protein n=1 Tax=Actinidia rufa TaxID=165716 RepID=A0A7J0G077_9ERIC|nr:hypothetical protein Acr_16g0009600 [Actinidia rufa]
MDREQEEMQFLGLFGIYAKPYKIILSWQKPFSQITLSHPPSLLHLPRPRRGLRPPLLQDPPQRAPIGPNPQSAPNPTPTSPTSSPPSVVLPLSLQVRYFTFLLVFSLLSTAAVVYAIVAAYAGRDITFAIVPRSGRSSWSGYR